MKKPFTGAIVKILVHVLGKILGAVLYYFDVSHRRTVKRNLKFIYPEWKDEKIRTISKQVFQNFGITVFEIIQMYFLKKKNILSNIHIIRGEEYLRKAIDGSNGVVLASAHIGNWESAALFVPCYYGKSVVSVARKIDSAIINKVALKMRTRFGNSIINKEGALPEMTRTVRSGNILAILIDQNTTASEGVVINFFGKKVTATPAAAMVAIRCNSPVIPAFCIREKNNQLGIIFEPPVKITRTKSLRDDLITNTQAINDVVEKIIREYPDQWLWMHKRWKKFHREIYPEYQSRHRRIREKTILKQTKGKDEI
uniref:Lipid A biosynthesis acyltransferase n=1 Tax=uncultured Desulfobacterium sp. TaxID=201089 RepID=E1YD15_9BACT|nr:hypothetical protein N47_G37830 [uncultured Desulfobacterium sp.]